MGDDDRRRKDPGLGGLFGLAEFGLRLAATTAKQAEETMRESGAVRDVQRHVGHAVSGSAKLAADVFSAIEGEARRMAEEDVPKHEEAPIDQHAPPIVRRLFAALGSVRLDDPHPYRDARQVLTLFADGRARHFTEYDGEDEETEGRWETSSGGDPTRATLDVTIPGENFRFTLTCDEDDPMFVRLDDGGTFGLTGAYRTSFTLD